MAADVSVAEAEVRAMIRHWTIADFCAARDRRIKRELYGLAVFGMLWCVMWAGVIYARRTAVVNQPCAENEYLHFDGQNFVCKSEDDLNKVPRMPII